MINSRSVMSAHTLVCCTAACTCYQCAGVSICVFVWFLIFLYSNSNMNLKTTEPSNWGRFESLPVKRRNRCAHTHSCLSSQFPLHGWINSCLPSQILTLVSQNKTSVSILTKAQLFNQDENKTIKQKKNICGSPFRQRPRSFTSACLTIRREKVFKISKSNL